MSVRRTVVLDGSNIVSGGAGGSEVDGHRLVSAVDLYEKKGYTVVPVMKNGTYYWMLNNEVTGFDAVRRLKNCGKLRMFGKDDDLYIIQMALDLNAWIVTQDTFEDKPNGIKKERSQFSDFPWDEIDDRTWGTSRRDDGRVRPNADWSVSGSKFYHPRLPECPSNGMVDSYSELREKISEVSTKLDEVEQLAEKAPEFGGEIRRHVRYMLKRCGKMEEILPEPRLPDEEELAAILVPGLKQILRSLRLKVSGRRAELVERILEHSSTN